MKTIGSILLLFISSSARAGQYEWINFYSGGASEGTYIWTWGFAEEPKSVDNTGFTPGTAAVEVKWAKADSFNYTIWSSYGVYFGDVGFDIEDIVPDSVYFKLKTPDGLGASDRLRVWLYDPRNSTWDNAYFYELENLQVLQDKEWHQFSVCLWDFQKNIGDMDLANVIAVSLERPAEDENTAFPLMYIDHVWVGLPDFVAVEEPKSTTVATFSLAQNYPNPFNPTTTIEFTVPRQTHVSIDVFNALGQKVAELANASFAEGVHAVNFQAQELPSGLYLYSLQADGVQIEMKKMLLVR